MRRSWCRRLCLLGLVGLLFAICAEAETRGVRKQGQRFAALFFRSRLHANLNMLFKAAVIVVVVVVVVVGGGVIVCVCVCVC